MRFSEDDKSDQEIKVLVTIHIIVASILLPVCIYFLISLYKKGREPDREKCCDLKYFNELHMGYK